MGIISSTISNLSNSVYDRLPPLSLFLFQFVLGTIFINLVAAIIHVNNGINSTLAGRDSDNYHVHLSSLVTTLAHRAYFLSVLSVLLYALNSIITRAL